MGMSFPYFILMAGGSYAEGSARKNSDLDLAVIVENEAIKKRLRAYLRDVLQLAEIKVDEHIFTKDEFKEMLVRPEENFGKELARKHLIIHNPTIFYSLIKEGMKHGFKL